MGERRLSGRRVVVTDANAFMGPDIVALFREEGADVIADSHDLTVEAAAERLVRGVGRVDVLMANLAAGFSGSLVEDVEDAELDLMFDRLVRPLHRLTRAVLPQMRERHSGKIVVVGSAVALKGVPGRAAYAAARGAQHAYVRNVGVEVAALERPFAGYRGGRRRRLNVKLGEGDPGRPSDSTKESS